MGELYVSWILIKPVCNKEGRKKLKEGRKFCIWKVLENFTQA